MSERRGPERKGTAKRGPGSAKAMEAKLTERNGVDLWSVSRVHNSSVLVFFCGKIGARDKG